MIWDSVKAIAENSKNTGYIVKYKIDKIQNTQHSYKTKSVKDTLISKQIWYRTEQCFLQTINWLTNSQTANLETKRMVWLNLFLKNFSSYVCVATFSSERGPSLSATLNFLWNEKLFNFSKSWPKNWIHFIAIKLSFCTHTDVLSDEHLNNTKPFLGLTLYFYTIVI